MVVRDRRRIEVNRSAPEFTVVTGGYDKSQADAYTDWATAFLEKQSAGFSQPSRDVNVVLRGYRPREVRDYLDELDARLLEAQR
ncbi:hypothetical protein ACQP2E_21215 [Actinoplanes sp. CA-015351]|uniref:hypothetical protein n=1 Tax=Actinoplanes sp. CA-015351 TaxID=3239897 RepID=UPI003D99D0A3